MKEDIQKKFGHVQIAESVIASVAGLAATEVKGVKCLSGGIDHESITHSDGRNLAKAVKVSIEDGKIALRIAVIVDGTASIPEVAGKLQEKIKSSVEMMTGNEVVGVDVMVSGVSA